MFSTTSDDSPPGVPEPPPEPPSYDARDRSRDERVERMVAGLVELDRWLDDRIRTGLAGKVAIGNTGATRKNDDRDIRVNCLDTAHDLPNWI